MAEKRFPQTRFLMKLDPWWRPVLLVGGAMPDNSYLEITDDGVIARFGLLFNRTIPREQIESAAEAEWPLWLGVGWRAAFGGRYGLIGSYNGIVELQLKEPIQILRFFSFTRIAVSLEEPQAFLDALAATPAASAPAEPAPSAAASPEEAAAPAESTVGAAPPEDAAAAVEAEGSP